MVISQIVLVAVKNGGPGVPEKWLLQTMNRSVVEILEYLGRRI
tara:strand:- start:2921 stop:3049 length:129 start_codon:yes stop_codon:yes gene_type:complete